MNITQFFDTVLKAPLSNSRNSWGAISRDGKLYLRVWEDHFQRINGRQYVLIMGPDWTTCKPGKERQRHIDALRGGMPTYGVLCQAQSNEEPRTIRQFDHKTIFGLGEVITHDGFIYAKVVSRHRVE